MGRAYYCRLIQLEICNFHKILNFRNSNLKTCSTVNSEIFARVLFSRNFVYAKFREKQNPREMAKSLCCLLIKVNRAIVAIFNVASMSSLNAIRENKILAKNSGATVCL